MRTGDIAALILPLFPEEALHAASAPQGTGMKHSAGFSEFVKPVRKRLGLSQKERAHELGVSFAMINRWENWKRVPFKLARRHFDEFCIRKKVKKVQ